jgi:hypothetical protein
MTDAAMLGVRKFGPHHFVMKTPLSNIRLTTFFAGKSEVVGANPTNNAPEVTCTHPATRSISIDPCAGAALNQKKTFSANMTTRYRAIDSTSRKGNQLALPRSPSFGARA